MSLLFSKYTLGTTQLQNRLVMAPLTRCRAIGNVPTPLMVEYYRQRNCAGLVIAEGTSPSADGLGYARMPGIYSEAQVAGWQKITAAVHEGGAKMFVQLMHCGRISHPLNLPKGARILAPSAVKAAGEMYTDAEGMKETPVPETMSLADIKITIADFAAAARNAIRAGFDGIELHGANGYLLEQFIRPNSNQRTDSYGGSIEGRARFVLETAQAVIDAIGKDKVGIRLSPYGAFNDMPFYEGMEADYAWLAERLSQLGLVYVHLVDHSSMGAPAVPDSIKQILRARFKGALILSGGYDAARAESDLAVKRCDLIAVGRAFIANPDLPRRWQIGAPLNTPDASTFYSADAHGYTDYPALG